MKKIFTFSLSAFFALGLMAQFNMSPNPDSYGKAKETNKKLYVVDGKITNTIAPRPENKANEKSAYNDYFNVELDGYGFGDQNQVPRFYWTMQDSSFLRIGVGFSHLFDFDNYVWFPASSLKDSGATYVKIDTIKFNFGHSNHSGVPNTFAVTIKSLPNAGPAYNGAVLWSDTTVSTDFTPGLAINILPELSIPVGISLPDVSKGIYVEVFFDGQVNDTASFLANYWNSGQNCAPVNGDGAVESFTYRVHSLATGLTQYVHDYNSQRFGNPAGTYYHNMSTFFDCNASGTYNRGTNEAYFMQNPALGYNYTYDFIIGEEELQMADAKINQNYPNPFSGVTTIEYSVENTTNISFEVFDITGKSVLALNEGTKTAGTYKIRIDGSGMDSGIYYYTFRTDNGAVTRKMIIQH